LFKPSFLSKNILKEEEQVICTDSDVCIFTSFIFFLIFFNFYQKAEDLNELDVKKPVAADIKRLKEEKSNLKMQLKS
jgi:hypothetical protein